MFCNLHLRLALFWDEREYFCCDFKMSFALIDIEIFIGYQIFHDFTSTLALSYTASRRHQPTELLSISSLEILNCSDKARHRQKSSGISRNVHQRHDGKKLHNLIDCNFVGNNLSGKVWAGEGENRFQIPRHFSTAVKFLSGRPRLSAVLDERVSGKNLKYLQNKRTSCRFGSFNNAPNDECNSQVGTYAVETREKYLGSRRRDGFRGQSAHTRADRLSLIERIMQTSSMMPLSAGRQLKSCISAVKWN